MAKQTIGIGSAANDRTGDPLRTAFDKANDNFDELYSSVGVLDSLEASRTSQIDAPQDFEATVVDEVGNINGTPYYAITFVTATGETEPTAELNRPGATAVNQKIAVTLPIGPAGVIARKIYRHVQNEDFSYETKLVGTVSNNTATEFIDNTAIGSEGAAALSINTTGGFLHYVNDVCVAQADQAATHFGWGAGNPAGNAGLHNTSYGTFAFRNIENHYWGLALGAFAMEDTVDGYECCAGGFKAMQKAINPIYSSAWGVLAGFTATVSLNRTLGGYAAGARATSSSNSTHHGQRAGSEILLDHQNSSHGSMAAVFYGAGEDLLTVCTNGAYYGYNTRAGNNTVDNETVVGANAIGSGSFTTTLGLRGQYFTRINGYADVRGRNDTLAVWTRENTSNVSLAKIALLNAEGTQTWYLRTSSDGDTLDLDVLTIKVDKSVEFGGVARFPIATWHGSGDTGTPAGRFHFFNNDSTLINGYGADPIQMLSNYGPAIKYNTTRGLISAGGFTCKPQSSATPVDNTELTVERTSDTQLTFKLKGSDGTVRSNTLTLS